METLHKFMNSLPSKWTSFRQIMRTNGSLKTHDLPSLYGTFLFEEQNAADVAKHEADSRKHLSSSSLSTALYSGTDHSVSSDNMCFVGEEISKEEWMNELMEEFAEKALMASGQKRFFRRGPPRFGGSSSRPPADKSNDECFKCGRKGHHQKECRQSTPAYPPKDTAKPSPNNSEDYYKQKFYKLLADRRGDEAKPKVMVADSQPEQGLIAETRDWYESDDEETETIHTMCLMALADDQDVIVDKSHVASKQWVDMVIKKVHAHTLAETEEDKAKTQNSYVLDLRFIEGHCSETSNQVMSQAAELVSCKAELSKLKEIHLALQTLEMTNNLVLKENESLKTEVANMKKICESWSRSAKLASKCISDQVPAGTHAVIGGDYETAAELPKCVHPGSAFPPPLTYNRDGSRVNSFVKPESIIGMKPNEGRVQTLTSDSECESNDFNGFQVMVPEPISPIKSLVTQTSFTPADRASTATTSKGKKQ